MNMLTSTKEYALIRILKTVKIVGHYRVPGTFQIELYPPHSDTRVLIKITYYFNGISTINWSWYIFYVHLWL